ncbi:DUF2510 domain-containing protein [Rhodococcus marinonascens]|uniref:DUF2510 domain-containing protein n=1 Tax=Rhodococcus marinonascens TaxID=38311 RepID=UPI0035A25815
MVAQFIWYESRVTEQTPIPAGWKTDPGNPTKQRYWNGFDWTEATRDPVVPVAVLEVKASQSASENSGMSHAVRASRRDMVAIMTM